MKKYRLVSLLVTLVLLAGVLSPAVHAAQAPEITAGAALLMDAANDEVLYEKNAYDRMYPASLTKVMTALLVLEAVDEGRLSLDQVVTASTTFTAGLTANGSTQNIQPGEQMSLLDLLYCLLVASANEASNILAETVDGSVSAFVERMNLRAQALGCQDTHFSNPHGLHADDHYTTAHDIYLIARAAMENETFRTIVSTRSHEVPATNMHKARLFYSTNALLVTWYYRESYIYDKAIGIKTGFTSAAGRCLASAAVDDDGRTFFCVVLGAENVKEEDGTTTYYAFKESKRLLEWAFDSFERTVLMDENLVIREVPVTLSDTDHVLVQPVGKVERTMPVDYDPDKAQLVVDLPESVEAPVAKDKVMGTVKLIYEGEELGTLNLVTVSAVERSETKYYAQVVEETVSQWWVKALIIAVVVLILILVIVICLLISHRRRERNRYRRYSYSGKKRRY